MFTRCLLNLLSIGGKKNKNEVEAHNAWDFKRGHPRREGKSLIVSNTARTLYARSALHMRALCGAAGRERNAADVIKALME